MSKITKESVIVFGENGTHLGTYDDLAAAKKGAAEVVTRIDKAYGTVAYVLKAVVKVEAPQPEAEITDLS